MVDADDKPQERDSYLWVWAQTPWLFTPGFGVPKVPPTQEEIEECYRQLVAGTQETKRGG